MPKDTSIPRDKPARPSQDYARLRDSAMAEIQSLASETWTDHNIHDPGIAIMEAYCYAMTELGLKLDLAMADLIASGTSIADPALAPSHEVLPVAPVTTADLRNHLLDHYLLTDVRISSVGRDRVDYFEAMAQTPPLTFVAPADPVRVVPSGLYDVRLAFRDAALNSNAFPFTIIVGPDQFGIEIATPYWDEPEVAPFLTGENAIVAVTLQNQPSPWRAIDASIAYFGRASVNYTGPGGAGMVEMPFVLRISGPAAPPPLALPGILAAATALVENVGAGGLAQAFQPRIITARAAARTVSRALITSRRLTEAPSEVAVSRVQDIAVNARIEVARTTGLEDLLAGILAEIDEAISPPVRFVDPGDLEAAGRDGGDILNGPLLTHGVAPQTGPGLVRGDRIFTSDILDIVMEPHVAAQPSPENPLGRDIVSVTDLTLTNFINNRSITTAASDCLTLVDTSRYRPLLSIAKSRIVLLRDGVELDYDASRIEALVAARRAAAEAAARLSDYDPDPPQPKGDIYDLAAYYPFQYDLPTIYGVTEAGLPVETTTERRQQARQLRAYLILMEQILSDAALQLANVNRLFLPDGAETATYDTGPLFQFDDMDQLVRRDPGIPWAAFIADPDNSYAIALRTAAESRTTRLDRRNRMLDHLMARHGEEMAAWGQELHRWGQRQVTQSALPPATLPARIVARQLDVNAQLLADKAAFLADLPRLHALRLQAFGDPAEWNPARIVVTEAGGQYSWRIAVDGQNLFEGITNSATRGEAAARSREALRLSGRAGFYGAQDFGGANNRRCFLMAEPVAGSPMIARGTQGFATLALATQAGATARSLLAALLVAESRSAFERRVDHQTGLRIRTRRSLVRPLGDFFDIVDAAPAPPLQKRWQLRRDPGAGAPVLLQSAQVFADPAQPAAIAAATNGIEYALQFALDAWNYRIAGPVAGSFTLELLDRDEVVVAAAPAPFTSAATAEAARDEVIALLYAEYSAEGFHMVETLLLRPGNTGETFLNLPGPGDIPAADPYSHRIAVVLPSGFERDFAAGEASRRPARPHRFRDAQFRRHMERTIRQSAPAHILPLIRWADRRIEGTQNAAGSFDVFETQYFAWLATEVMPGASPASQSTTRNQLIATLNAITAA